MKSLKKLGFTDDETKIVDAALTLFGEKFAEKLIGEIEKDGPCVLCKNEYLDKCEFCPATPKKEIK